MNQFPPNLSEAELIELRHYAVDWALSHGLIYRPAASPPVPNFSATATHAPVSLFPSPFPKNAYDAVKALQPLFNQLVQDVSHDHEFLSGIMESIADVDDFTGRIYDIYKTVRKEGVRQKISLGLFRSDYILHVPVDAPEGTEAIAQQVELNTIAVSFGSLAAVTGDLHRYLLARTNYFQKGPSRTGLITREALPTNKSSYGLAKGLAKAHSLYGNDQAVVVMIVQQNERNVFDQRFLEQALFERYGVKLVRRTLTEVHATGRIRETDGALILNDQEISVVYYRGGYMPEDYPSASEWDARLLMERSLAVKCPSAAYHLAGAKKVQQVLAMEGVLERFVKDSKHCASMRSSFAGLYPLDTSPSGEAAAKMAMEDPSRFVMKPQREGGGNNIYAEDIPKFLQHLEKSGKSRERDAYILMDMIRPPKQSNQLLRLGAVVESEVISELGIYGIYISDGSVTYLNEEAGHNFRTKQSGSHEGGVAAGFAVLDSPLLV